MTRLADYVRTRREEVERALDRFLPAPPACPALVAEAMRYSVMGGGKRLRPLLALAAADAVTGPPFPSAAAIDLVMPTACAVEMIHTYSLIHDDLPAMDDDTLRRGRPTLHVVHGEGMAILAGDGLQAAAFALVAREPDTGDAELNRRKVEVIRLLADAAGPAGMVGGQALDLYAVMQGARQSTVGALEEMHSRKTGALIRAAAVAGAIMAGAEARMVTAIETFAGALGLAFQIVDDILDVEAESDTLGKTAGKDAAAGKPTYASELGVEQSRVLADACVARGATALSAVGLQESMLYGFARWVVERRH